MIFLSLFLDKILSNRVLTHILYWLAIFAIAVLYGLAYGEPLELAIILKKISLPTQIIASYLFVYIQLPLLDIKRYWIFFLSFLLSSYLFHIIMHICNDLWFGKHLVSYHSNHTFLEIIYSSEYYLSYAVDIYMVVFITAGIKLIKNNLEQKKEVESLEAEKAQKEYQYLQARMQPEFLLNTLDQIEQESKSDNHIAAKSIADLSEILDYSLYKTDYQNVSLSDEYRQMELFAKLYVRGSKSISSIVVSLSNISKEGIVKPMTLVKVMGSILNYLEAIHGSNKSLTVETTSIEESILLDLYITGIKIDSISTIDLKLSIDKNIVIDQLEITNYPAKEGHNLQIKFP